MDEVVANDIILGKDYTTIVITGPNTGGKTVTVKNSGSLYINGTSRVADSCFRWIGNGCF